MRIKAYSQYGTNPGFFSYSLLGSPTISIYNNNRYDHGFQLGNVLHELGHYAHYGLRGGTYSMYNKPPKLIKESFASYVGWYLTELYYSQFGYTRHPSLDFTGNARQYWTQYATGDGSWYSPLFVDLIDDFNQYTYFGGSHNRDNITGVPHSVIMNVIAAGWDWAKCKSVLHEYDGLYYTTAALNTFLAPYDYYF